MQIPRATYRLQFSPQFGFQNAANVAEYLSALGISHLYASPIFAARAGSTHGYDVVDPNALNAELGTVRDFDRLHAILHKHEMGWIQDIVPNHMAFDSKNHMLMNVLENGAASPYFTHFDIEWNHPYENLRGKVLAPHLGRFYGACLEDAEIQLAYDSGGFSVQYYELKLPLRLESYLTLLVHDLKRVEKELGKDDADFRKLQGVISILERGLPLDNPKERGEQIHFCKETLWRLYTEASTMRSYIDDVLRAFNGEKGIPDSFTMLDRLLSEQLFRLSFWKVATEEINYRRFFNINQLISMRVEDEKVFRDTHDLIMKSIWHGDFDGVRIDHVDGLYDPASYLRRLRDAAPDAYIVVEKILEHDEELPPSWPIQGTSGYDFLNAVNALFCTSENERELTATYHEFSGREFDFNQLAIEKKRLIIGRHMAGDIDRLAHLLKSTASHNRYARDITLYALRRALVEILALFPVYRTYVAGTLVEEQDKKIIRNAVQATRTTNPALILELDFIEQFLLLEFADNISPEEQQEWVKFVMRFQQLTGPLMAKGFEDTVLYNYNRLVSLNEVGGNPKLFGGSAEQFHAFIAQRAAAWPHAMNATATHDTKRGEDVRARINVLSEMPAEWRARVLAWKKMNRDKKQQNPETPDANDEYLLYQTLIGTFPFHEDRYDEYISRIKEYMIKAIREAKAHTAWLKPDESYENATLAFVDAVMQRSEQNVFLADFTAFQNTINHYGVFNSLAQTLLKATVPGVPDFYQGTELWDLSLVDPDNRRQVDFDARLKYLHELKREQEANPAKLIPDLLEKKEDGRIKLFTVAKALSARRQSASLFERGEYVPLRVSGKWKSHIIAFARRANNEWAITVVPMQLVPVISSEQLPLGKDVWQDTAIELPESAPTRMLNVMTMKYADCGRPSEVGSLLADFPVALLVGQCNQE